MQCLTNAVDVLVLAVVLDQGHVEVDDVHHIANIEPTS